MHQNYTINLAFEYIVKFQKIIVTIRVKAIEQ